jgi:hypothetical protein
MKLYRLAGGFLILGVILATPQAIASVNTLAGWAVLAPVAIGLTTAGAWLLSR